MFSLVITVNQRDYSSKEKTHVRRIKQSGKPQPTAPSQCPAPSSLHGAHCTQRTSALSDCCLQGSATAPHTLDISPFLLLDHSKGAGNPCHMSSPRTADPWLFLFHSSLRLNIISRRPPPKRSSYSLSSIHHFCMLTSV